jgi:site-specific DNA recombinase
LFCDGRTAPESNLEQTLITAINNKLSTKDTFLTVLQNNIATVLTQKNDKALINIEDKLVDLQVQLIKLL